jgi:hypothetical protein
MTNFEITPFEELNQEAALIAEQNSEYGNAGKDNPKFAHIYKNVTASEQSEHIELLGAMSDDLPYEQLLPELSRLEADR